MSTTIIMHVPCFSLPRVAKLQLHCVLYHSQTNTIYILELPMQSRKDWRILIWVKYDPYRKPSQKWGWVLLGGWSLFHNARVQQIVCPNYIHRVLRILGLYCDNNYSLGLEKYCGSNWLTSKGFNVYKLSFITLCPIQFYRSTGSPKRTPYYTVSWYKLC